MILGFFSRPSNMILGFFLDQVHVHEDSLKKRQDSKLEKLVRLFCYIIV